MFTVTPSFPFRMKTFIAVSLLILAGSTANIPLAAALLVAGVGVGFGIK